MIYVIITKVYCLTNGSLEAAMVDLINEFWFHFPWDSLTLPTSGGQQWSWCVSGASYPSTVRMRCGWGRTFPASPKKHPLTVLVGITSFEPFPERAMEITFWPTWPLVGQSRLGTLGLREKVVDASTNWDSLKEEEVGGGRDGQTRNLAP